MTRRPLLVEVEAVERLTPQMVRIVFGGRQLDGFVAAPFTDQYVKLQFPPPEAPYGAPFDLQEVRGTLPREQWPRTRTYTVRAWDPGSRRLTIDFIVHGEEGVAGPWAAAARVGDRLQLMGPGGAYVPDREATWHLMLGDTSVIPAISLSLGQIPADRPVRVLVQVDGPEDELPLQSPGELGVDWLYGHGATPLVEALRRLEFLPGTVDVFVHGEAAMVRAVRRYLVLERGIQPASMSASGYWKRSRTDEGWREDKAEWKRLVEADVADAVRPAPGAREVGRGPVGVNLDRLDR